MPDPLFSARSPLSMHESDVFCLQSPVQVPQLAWFVTSALKIGGLPPT